MPPKAIFLETAYLSQKMFFFSDYIFPRKAINLADFCPFVAWIFKLNMYFLLVLHFCLFFLHFCLFSISAILAWILKSNMQKKGVGKKQDTVWYCIKRDNNELRNRKYEHLNLTKLMGMKIALQYIVYVLLSNVLYVFYKFQLFTYAFV